MCRFRFLFSTWALLVAGLSAQDTIEADLPPVDAEEEDLEAESGISVPAAGEVEYWEAVRLLEDGTEDGENAFRDKLEASARLECTHAQNLLGGCYQSGDYGFRKSERKAAQYFRLAAERGNAFAQVNLGRAYLYGLGVWKSEKKGRAWLEQALAEDADYSLPPAPDWVHEKVAAERFASDTVSMEQTPNDISSWMLAHFLLGLEDSEDEEVERSLEHYLAASSAGPDGRYGIAKAAKLAALQYAFGKGVDRDLGRANELLERSRTLALRQTVVFVHGLADLPVLDRFSIADINELVKEHLDDEQTDLQYTIAWTFQNDKGEDFDPVEAAKWFEIAANDGKHTWAMLLLARMYYDGDLGAPDFAQAEAWYRRAGEEGNHSLGWANYALCHYHGIGVPKDHGRVAEIVEESKRRNIVCYLLGQGIPVEGILTYEEMTDLVEHWARKKKDPHARYLLGRRYRFGWGFDYNRSTANKWFRRAADQGHAGAFYELGYAYENGYGYTRDYEKAARNYQEAFKLGDADAAFKLAWFAGHRGLPSELFLIPEGPRSDDAESQQIFFYEQNIAREPSECGASWNNLGSIIERRAKRARDEGDTVRFEKERARMSQCYEEAAKQEEEHAYYNLGKLAYDGDLVEKDLKKAYRDFVKAAEGGHSLSNHYLGKMLLAGEGVGESEEEAMHYFRLVALDDDSTKDNRREALAHLASFYLRVAEGRRDIDAAQFWVARLALEGSVSALCALGDLQFQLHHYKDARKLFYDYRKIKNTQLQGFACYRLYQIYRDGLDVRVNERKAQGYLEEALELEATEALLEMAIRAKIDKDFAKAREWYERATAAGSEKGAFDLGCLLFSGAGGDRELDRAYELFRKAAAGGYVEANYSLALAAYQGLEGAPSLEEGLEYCIIAEKLGHENAPKLRRIIEKKLKPQEVEDTSVGTGARGTA